jgi:hypothetical protein
VPQCRAIARPTVEEQQRRAAALPLDRDSTSTTTPIICTMRSSTE